MAETLWLPYVAQTAHILNKKQINMNAKKVSNDSW
jgi:lactate dehydrogenase-like 2-hydroxyacid dehydrogenase